MGLTIVRWIDISFIIILYTAICIGQLTLLPETVPFENESWKLVCKADTLADTLSFSDPSSTTIGFCVPLADSCSGNPGYALAMNLTENTVTMTRTLANNDNGTWTCSHPGDSASYVLQSPLLSRNFPQSKTDYFYHSMTASPGIEIDTTESDYTFTFHYGCVSTNLKFQWTTVPGDPWDDTSNTASTALSCTTNQAFKSTKLTSEILPKVKQDGSKLKVSVYVDGYYNLQAVEEYTFNVTFSAFSPDGGGSSSWIVIVSVIVLVILVIVIIVILCCLFNKRCRSRYLRKNSKFIFTFPRKDITVIDNNLDNDLEIERPEGLEIEIQCLRSEKGQYMHDYELLHDDIGIRVRNNSCILFNTYFGIDSLNKKHAGVYKYRREQNLFFSKTDCSLMLKISKDKIITWKSIVHWAHEGEWLGLQVNIQSSDLQWIKTNLENGKVTKIKSQSKENRLVLKNINIKDAGSYHLANTKEMWTSRRLTLKIVNNLVKVGKEDDSHIAIVRKSIKLKFTEYKLSSIKLLKWKKSLLTDATKFIELEFAWNYELILSDMTKKDEGYYWCEVDYNDGTSTKSGILTLQVVHAIVGVDMKSASYSATVGDSIQMRCTKKIIPHHIIFSVKRSGTNQIAPKPKITKTAALLIKKISKGDEGCYQFESADGKAKTGVLTLSVTEDTDRYSSIYTGRSGNPTQPRRGANQTLDSLTEKAARKQKRKNKKRKSDKEETNIKENGDKIEIEYQPPDKKDS